MPTALCIPDKHLRNLACSPLLVGSTSRKKTDHGQRSASPSEPPGSPLRFSRTRFQPFCLARRRSICLPRSPNLVVIRPIEHDMVCVCVLQRPISITVTVLPASRVPPNCRSEEAPPVDTILSQPNRRRVSTDRLNRLDNHLVASLQGESGPIPAGKTLPHSGHTHIPGGKGDGEHNLNETVKKNNGRTR